MSGRKDVEVARWLDHEKRISTVEEAVAWIKRALWLVIGLQAASIGVNIANHLGFW